MVNGEFKICNIVDRCSGSACPDHCIINKIINRLYELEHKNDYGNEQDTAEKHIPVI